ncbi:MAG: Hpt domain-containing protein [Spirochaetaceae bacterium]|nr:Hpt domain-containing protein [Spirochaetaceae bacterium]
MSDEILAAFAAESAEIVDGLEEQIRELGNGSREALDALFRLVHTLKGSASIVGLARLESFAHAWESRLGRMRSGAACYTSACAGALLSCRDAVARLIEGARPSIGADETEEGGLGPGEVAVLAALDAAMALSAGAAEPARAAEPAGASPAEAAPGKADSTESAGHPIPAVEPGAEHAAEPLAERAPASAGREAPQGEHRGRAFDGGYARVANQKLELILSGASELAQSISELGREIRELGDSRLLDRVQVLHSHASQLYRNILETRTVPFGEVAERYRRAVADIARESGKALRFELVGADTEIDKALADRLAEPLLHMVRNAADHGVEKPEVRLAAGKKREGVVALKARRESGALVVRVEDDGRGVEPEAIRRRAKEAGLGDLGIDVDGLDDEGLLALLFRPGFSLSGSVTKWSGRGVGLDAVERNVRAFRGSVHLETRPGRGFAAEIRLPLALSLVEGFTARAGETSLLVPFEAVRSCVAFDDDGLASSPYRNVPVLSKVLPSIDLGILYGECAVKAQRIIAVVESGGVEAGLVLDEVGEALSAAVRPIDRRFADSPGVAGVAALGDGSLVLVLDPAELIRLALAR